MIQHYDRAGREISLLRWAELFEDGDYQRLLLTKFKVRGEPVEVSTV